MQVAIGKTARSARVDDFGSSSLLSESVIKFIECRLPLSALSNLESCFRPIVTPKESIKVSIMA